MAYTTIDDPSAYFQALAYRGDSTSTTSADRSLTNDGNSNLQPDIVWIANRDSATNSGMRWWDSSRGVGQNKGLTTSGYNLEGGPNDPEYGYVNTLSSNGFGVRAGANDTSGRWTTDRGEGGGDKYIAWQWKANGGSTSSNTDGSLTSTVQVNSTSGISIGTYTGDADYSTVGHGLGVIPDLVIIKGRDGSGLGGAAQYWVVGCPNTSAMANGGSKLLFLDSNSAVMTNTSVWYNTAFTTTTIPIGPHAAINGDGAAYIFYAFKNIQGYSKIGQYTGNLNANGPFVYTGFKPAFVMIKPSSEVEEWVIFDSTRNPYNQAMLQLKANSTAVEYNGASVTNGIDILSNGFKVRTNRTELNTSNATYIYVAFAENPFVTSTGTPTTAR